MPDMSLNKVKMPEQDPNIRNKNFCEVSLGYDSDMAMREAARCLNCKNRPCMSGCPVNVKIPEFIELVSKGDFEGAYYKIKETNSLPAICGRVCPQESQCEGKCIRGIKGESVGIGRLERFVADWFRENCCEKKPEINKNGKKVAVVGAGPSGLTCASDLVKLGYDVTVFEAFHSPGGVLVYGIPEFRLPKDIVKHEIDTIQSMGVEIQTNTVIGKTLTIDEILDSGYDAVYVASGAGLPVFMGIEGEDLVGVYSANEFLTRINLMKAYLNEYDTPIKRSKSVAVIGGGNVAMDAARSAKRLGAEHVYIIYRRSIDEMPARKEEVHHAGEEGIEFMLLTNPIKINGDDNGFVKSIECVKMELSEPDASGRRKPVKIQNSEFEIDVDSVIMAIGTSPNPLIRKTTSGISANEKGCIIVDDSLKTTKDGVYSGGDAVTGAATVILAMGAGKKAAHSIDEYLKTK